MPCRCDDYFERQGNPTNYASKTDLFEAEHEKRCHAQSLVNKLACLLEKNNVKLTEKLKKNIEACRKDLALHKREEHNKDVDEKVVALKSLEGKIKQIKILGGIVPDAMTSEAEAMKIKIKSLREITDSELLGNETT